MNHLDQIKQEAEKIRGVTDKLARLAYSFEDTGNPDVCEKLLDMRRNLYDIYDRLGYSIENIERQLPEGGDSNE